MEIERKFLFSPDQAPFLEQYPSVDIAQSYISADPVIRLRKITVRTRGNTEYVLTVKSAGLKIREEFEMALDEKQYENLLPKIESNTIKKTRYSIPLTDGYTAEADIFHGHLTGLMTVEVEFANENEMTRFIPPAWFGRDVSDESEYQNVNLAMRNSG